MATMTPEESIHHAMRICQRAEADLVPSESSFDLVLDRSKKESLPNIAISPAYGSYLSIICQLISARRILEIGALGGYSTLWFAKSHPEVHVTSIEVNPRHHKIASENLAAAGQKNVEFVLGAALDVLPKLAEKEERFDLVFIDASWTEQWDYFDWAVKLSRKGACIIVDNAVRQLTESADDDPTARILIEKLQTDARVQATIQPTLNLIKSEVSEIIDGYVMAIVK